MPEVTEPYPPGTPCWVDLMVPDQQAALDFYRDLFGWQGEVGPEEYGGYALCTQRGRPVAGIMQSRPAANGEPPPPSSWTTYFASGDIGSTEGQVVDAGGALLVPPMQVGRLGWMMVGADPQGAVFGLWQGIEFPGAGIVNEHGALVWNQLITTEVPGAAQFYRALCLECVPMRDMPGFTAFQVRGHTVGGVQDMSNMDAGIPPHWLVYFAVDDVDSTVDAVVHAGGNVRVPPFDLEKVGRMAVVEDPQRALFAVVTPVGQTA
ncbi:VOC family protein [Streptomyces montanisoli]|uniref:VOC family protein n=1 Tax=Streptomyces montanisoli TaxID=2798581 RepID=A0A940MED2_9ACTN|nr:VOC family protein [Streptomyces montanisoli]MBP0461519.1 VOC family protein [Streptomyces montanisoli]